MVVGFLTVLIIQEVRFRQILRSGAGVVRRSISARFVFFTFSGLSIALPQLYQLQFGLLIEATVWNVVAVAAVGVVNIRLGMADIIWNDQIVSFQFARNDHFECKWSDIEYVEAVRDRSSVSNYDLRLPQLIHFQNRDPFSKIPQKDRSFAFLEACAVHRVPVTAKL